MKSEKDLKMDCSWMKYSTTILDKYDQLVFGETPKIVEDKCLTACGYSHLSNFDSYSDTFEKLFWDTEYPQDAYNIFDIMICKDGTIDVDHFIYPQSSMLMNFAVFPASIINEDRTVSHAVLICIDGRDPDNLTWSLIDSNGNGWYDGWNTDSIVCALSVNPKMNDFLNVECQICMFGDKIPKLKYVLPINIHDDPDPEKKGCCAAWMILMAILMVNRCSSDGDVINQMLLSLDKLGNEKRIELVCCIIAEFPK